MADDVAFDLDVLRAARQETERAEQTFRFGDEVFSIPTELPVAAVVALNVDGDGTAFARELLGAEQWPRFLERGPTVADCWELALAVGKIYGVSPGEAPASAGSSPKSGSRSRRTSGASTASTSAKRSGAKARRG